MYLIQDAYVLFGLLAVNEKLVRAGCLHKTISAASERALDVFSVAGEAPSLFEANNTHLDWWQDLKNVLEGADLHSKVYNILLFRCQSINQSINQLSRCLISVSTDSKAHHPIRKA